MEIEVPNLIETLIFAFDHEDEAIGIGDIKISKIEWFPHKL